MNKLYREFILDTEPRWNAAKLFIENNWRGFAEQKIPLRLIITTAEAKRNSEQNKRYWKAVLEQISQQVWLDGQQFSKDAWHEHYAEKFGVKEEIRMPDGGLKLRRKSTTEYKVREFSDYMTQVEADAAQEYGVRFFIQDV